MKPIQMWAAGFLGAATLLPLSAHAEGPYVGGSALYANRPGYDDVDGSFGGKVFAGYRFAPFPLFIEARYLNTGNADVDPCYGGAAERIKLRFSGYPIGNRKSVVKGTRRSVSVDFGWRSILKKKNR